MPTIRINGAELEYREADIITFDEGLIGLPALRRMVLVNHAEAYPFLWLASLDDNHIAFLVLDPRTLFPAYAPPHTTLETDAQINFDKDETPLILSIVTIRAPHTHSTINLRAPLFISPARMRGAQIALVASAYQLAEPLPLAQAA